MEQNRREFLKRTAWMGAAAIAAGCISKANAVNTGIGAPMHGFCVAPMKQVRVGFIGIGSRGTAAGRQCYYQLLSGGKRRVFRQPGSLDGRP